MSKKSNAKDKSGNYRSRVCVGKDENGRYKYKSFYGKTQSEANKKAREYKATVEKGIDIAGAEDSFAKWAERWLRFKKGKVGNSQYKTYESLLKHLTNSFGGESIMEIRMMNIQDLIDNLASGQSDYTGKPLSYKTLKEIKGTAVQVFNYAVDNRAIEYNPASRVIIPEAEKSERKCISDKQQAMITFFPHRMQAPAMIMLYAGLRRGEVIPLEWSDIDFDNQTITVSKAVELSNNQPELKTTKTEAGNRVVFINPVLLNFLKKHKAQSKSKYVCPSLNGGMFTQSAWSKAWSSYLLDMDIEYGTERKSKYNPNYSGLQAIEPFTPHQLRHTFATKLIESGVNPKEAQTQIGHKSVTTTLDIYTHLSDKHIKQEMQKYNDFINNRIEYLESLIK